MTHMELVWIKGHSQRVEFKIEAAHKHLLDALETGKPREAIALLKKETIRLVNEKDVWLEKLGVLQASLASTCAVLAAARCQVVQ